VNEFLHRLKERKLVQWALAYLAGAFALLQGLDIVAQQFGWPDGVRRGITIVLMIGFFVTLILAWYHGERGAQRVTGVELSILALLLAIGGAILWRVAPSVGSSAPHASDAAVPASAAPGARTSAKSVAVLPFENLSDEKTNAYFASGMQDEILTRLAGIHDLKVISRTSTLKYASHPEDLKTVGLQLGVATVLEGSVQKSGDTAHINVQLIDAANDAHLWASSYDRELKDLFGVERDVAEKVADALKATLLPAESARIAGVPTRNAEAYDRFLKAEYLFNRFYSGGGSDWGDLPKQAQEMYESAIAADPDFALAHARLAFLIAAKYWWGIDSSPQALEAAHAAATRALALQPDLPEAHVALGHVHYWGHRDYAAALREFELARAALPNDASVLMAIAAVHRRQGDLEHAIPEWERALVLDPRNTVTLTDFGITMMQVRRYGEAAASAERAQAVAPDNAYAPIYRAAALLMGGDAEAADRVLGAIPAGNDPLGGVTQQRFRLALATRRPDTALAALAKSPLWLSDAVDGVIAPAAMLRAQALALKGDDQAAHAAFDEARQLLDARRSEMPGENDTRRSDIDADLALVAAGLGQKDAALKFALLATEALPLSRDVIKGAAYLAMLAKVEAQVGQSVAALDDIQRLLSAPTGFAVSAASLRLDPAWDPLRREPRFDELIAAAANAEKQALKP